MEKVRRMNRKFAMCPRRRRRLLREEALAAWRFQPSHMFEASQRDMKIVTRALVTVLNSRPDEGAIMGTSKEKNARPCTSKAASSSSSSCYPTSPESEDAVEAKTKAGVEVSDSMAPGNRTPAAEALSRSRNNQRSIPAMDNIIGKKRSRRGKIPLKDPTDCQATVQKITAASPLENNSKAAPCLLKSQPERPDRIGSNMIPSDSSSSGLLVGINGIFDTCPHYLHPAAFCNNLAENSVYSVGTATSGSDFDSMGFHKANSL